MKYTKISSDAFEHLQLNAGILLKDFDTTTGTFEDDDIVGTTSGGIKFSAKNKYVDLGDDIDNAMKNSKELKLLESVEVMMSGNFVDITDERIKILIAAADKSGGKITPRIDLKLTDFANDMWWIGDYGTSGGCVAVHCMNVLSTGGLSIQSTDKKKSKMAFEFTAHPSIEDELDVPYEIYVIDSFSE